MCGLFGLLRSPSADNQAAASEMFLLLGEQAEERGRDAAGLAFLRATPRNRMARSARPLAAALRYPDVETSGWRVVKGCRPFGQVWHNRMLPDLDNASLVLGHTRWATQGDRKRLANAGPMLVHGLVGTHNGDVDAGALRAEFSLPRPTGGTDSEVIFQALARNPDGPVKVLTALRGRAALAWADLRRPFQVQLARAALSPLAVAIDSQENVYWASNPQWLREAAAFAGVDLVTLRMLAEGTYTTISAAPLMMITTKEKFTATARPQDRFMDQAVWRGFNQADRAADKAQQRHVTRPATGRVRAGRARPGAA